MEGGTRPESDDGNEDKTGLTNGGETVQATSRELSESFGSFLLLREEGGVVGQKQRHSLGRPSGNSSGLNARLELSFVAYRREGTAFRRVR